MIPAGKRCILSMVITTGRSKPKGVEMKTSALIGALFVTLLSSSCLSFFQQQPRYVDGTNILIRNSGEGEDYVVRIGESSTTMVDAVLSGNGSYRIAYTYTDSHWLHVNRLVFETYCCLSSVETRNPQRVESGDGNVSESEEIGVQRQLFEEMTETDTPIIFIEGEQGSVIIKMGKAGKERLRDLLDYESEIKF